MSSSIRFTHKSCTCILFFLSTHDTKLNVIYPQGTQAVTLLWQYTLIGLHGDTFQRKVILTVFNNSRKVQTTKLHFTSLSYSFFFSYTDSHTHSEQHSVYVFLLQCALKTRVHMHASVSTQTEKDTDVDTVSYQMGNRTGTAAILHQCLPDAARDHRLASCPTPPS